MAAGDNSALGAVSDVDEIGQAPSGSATYTDVIRVVGDGDYKAGGTPGSGTSTLLAALRALRGDGRTILSAWCTGQVVASSGAAVTSWRHVVYDRAHDKIQCFECEDDAAMDEVADGTNLSTIKFEFTVISK